MASPAKHTVTVTTDSSGDATAYTGVGNGRVHWVKYAKTDFADGVDFTITTEDTAQNVWVESNVNAAKDVSPRQNIHDADDGTEVTYDGTNEAYGYIWIAYERIKIVVASGGDTKTGTFTVLTDE